MLADESKDDKYPNQNAFLFYKIFFERILFKFPKLKNNNQAVNDTYTELSVDQFSIYRSHSLFSEVNRNREEKKNEKKDKEVTAHAGILSDAATPIELQNKLSAKHSPAKFEYKRMNIKKDSHFLPFSAGASGTLVYGAYGIHQLFPDLTPEEYKQYFMGMSAHLVYEGHHSFAEAGLLIDSLHDEYRLRLLRKNEDIDENHMKENTIYLRQEGRGFCAYTIEKTDDEDIFELFDLTLSLRNTRALRVVFSNKEPLELVGPDYNMLIADIANQCNFPSFKKGIGYPVNFDLSEKEFYDQFMVQAYRESDQYQKFTSQHHPQMYHGLTWEMLNDARSELGDKCIILNRFITQNREK